MSQLTQFLGSGGSSAPIVVTEYTSGTGTHTWNASTKWARVVLVGGGGGGGRNNIGSTGSHGGGAGAVIITDIPVLSASVPYAVGAAGTGATSANTFGIGGGNTTLGNLVAPGAVASANHLTGGAGGLFTNSSLNVSHGHRGSAGGLGGGASSSSAGSDGRTPGFTNLGYGVGYGISPATTGSGGGGGASLFGNGGNGGDVTGGTTGLAGDNATGYGGGGGGGGSGSSVSGNGGNGSGGYIKIEEYAE